MATASFSLFLLRLSPPHHVWVFLLPLRLTPTPLTLSISILPTISSMPSI